MELHPIFQIAHFPRLQRVVRTPTTNEWKRFRRYTARVVELSVEEVSPETISFLGMQSTLDPLWHRLASLRLTEGLGWDAVTSTLTFLSPKIIHLTLILPRHNSILLQPTLSIASDRCHWLQELVLDTVADDSHSVRWVGKLISASRSTLRTLEIRSPFKTGYLLTIIASLTQLRNLRLEGVHFPSDLPSDAFPTLEEVTFVRLHGQRPQHFFEHLRTTTLKVVKVHATDTVTFKESITALARFSPTLRVLEISGVADLDLPSVVIPHLFTNLTTVHLRCCRRGDPCAFRPTDKAIAELGAAMPNITHLSLGSPGCSNLRCITFLSLISLSQTCKNLETLTVRVDFQTMVTPPPSENRDAGAGRTFDGTLGNWCKLHKLVVGVSNLPRNPESGWIVAVGLGEIFPSLSEIVGYGPERPKWEQVSRNIKMLRQVHRTMQQQGLYRGKQSQSTFQLSNPPPFAMFYRRLSHGVPPYRHRDNTPSDSLD